MIVLLTSASKTLGVIRKLLLVVVMLLVFRCWAVFFMLLNLWNLNGNHLLFNCPVTRQSRDLSARSLLWWVSLRTRVLLNLHHLLNCNKNHHILLIPVLPSLGSYGSSGNQGMRQFLKRKRYDAHSIYSD